MKKVIEKIKLKYTILILVLSFSLSSKAQNALNVSPTGSIFVVGSNSLLYVRGNTLVDGQVSNTGTITMTGDLTVNNTWTSIGMENFSGPGNQNINSSISGTNYFGYWVKSNTGKIFLFGNIDADSINFTTDGFIDATTGVTVKIKSGLPTAIKGYNALRYVDVDDNLGTLSRNISSTNTYVFPIGNSVAGYRRFDMLMTSLGATGTSFLNAKLKNNSPGTINYSRLYATGFSGTFPGTCTPGSNAQHVDFECMADHYWNFSGPSDYQFTTLAYGSPCVPSGTGPRRVLRSQFPTGDWTGTVTDVIGTLTDQLCLYSDWTASASAIPGGTYQGFGDFGIAGTFGAPLPVELLAFTVSAINNQYLHLDWATASESNNAGFAIERSTGNNWTQIGWINGNGNSNTLKQYVYNDKTVSPDTVYYYRLRQVDADRTFKYSNIVSGKLTGTNSLQFSFYPNPTNGIVTVKNRNNSIITIRDVLGRIVKTIPTDATTFDISELANGTYIMNVIYTDNQTESFKLLKIK